MGQEDARWEATRRQPEVSPHFAYLPRSALEAGSLWFEVAIGGIVLWEHDGQMSRHLGRIRRAITEGRIERRDAHGQPYWVKHEREHVRAQ